MVAASGTSGTDDQAMDVDEEPIDKEQLDEYREMVDQLGTFPDKVKINTLSMVAEDHAESWQNADSLYQIIRDPLVSRNVPGDRKLPLVYVVDSVLKNVKGQFKPIIENDAKVWLPVVYDKLSEEKRAKLRKVWNLWKDAGIFEESSWKEMGACFTTSAGGSSSPVSNSKLEEAGISFGKDGGLLLMPTLRSAMQSILDDLQSDVQDELEKVSLERLASIDPGLLVKIKRTAEDSLRNGGGGSDNRKVAPSSDNDQLSFLVETRASEAIERSKIWSNLKLDRKKETSDLVHILQHLVMDATKTDKRYTQQEALDMTGALAAAGAAATILTGSLQLLDIAEKQQKTSASSTGSAPNSLNGVSGGPVRGFFKMDKSLFTNDGIKKKHDVVIGILYEIGLPFVSSADGRRFATQLELSNHLDALFKKGQLEKTMARTEERGWYVQDSVWSGASKADVQGIAQDDSQATAGPVAAEEEADPSTFTVPADESRDRCVICGINFKMFFDNDDGIYKYNNCKEIELLNDDAAANPSDEMLVHVTCWRALGSPTELSSDQVLQDVVHS